jgi:sucrose-6-phosphate hydrolase SacC (GH32 family)
MLSDRCLPKLGKKNVFSGAIIPEDRGSMLVFRNVSSQLPDYMASQAVRQQYEY